MKSSYAKFLATSALLLGFQLQQGTLRAATFQAAIEASIVTPDPLLPISGGVGPSHPVSEKRGDLTVRALVVESGDTRVAVVSTDFLGFPAIVGDRVRALVPDIPPHQILIGATHTHSAPDMYGFPDGQGGYAADLNYIEHVVQQTAETINRAIAHLAPATIKVGTDEAHGKIAYNYYAEKLYDPRCDVIQFVKSSGEVMGTLVNYAVHPEVLGPKAGYSSPDIIGPLYDRITAQGGGIGLFMNGAQGGMVTADNRSTDGRDTQTWEECIRIGHLLADEALRIVSDAPVQTAPSLTVHAEKLTFPVDSPILWQIMQLSPLDYPKTEKQEITTTINLVNLGNAQILTIPGEALPNIGYYLKRNMRGEHNLLFGLTNDAFGYILTRVDWGSFERYNYITRTSLGERTGEIFIQHALKMIAGMPAATLPE